MVKFEKGQGVTPWNNKTWFEKGNYKARIKDERNYVSDNSGNFLKSLEWEIYAEAPMLVGKQEYDVDGVEFTTYHVLRKVDPKTKEFDEALSTDSQRQFQERILEKLNVDIGEGWDPENPPALKGKFAWVSLYGKKRNNMVKVKNEETGKIEEKPQVDPVTKKEVEVYDINMDQIFGLCDDEPHRPF